MIGKLADTEIEELLKENIWGHLGCNDGFNTYIYPTNYFYDGRFIMCHSQNGSKIQIMQHNSRVCFQVEEVEDHKSWKSVMVRGDFQELTDDRERYAAVKAFGDRRMYIKTSDTALLYDPTGIAEDTGTLKKFSPVIYRIVIDEKTGRFEDG